MLMNKQIALISIITLALTVVVGFGAYVMFQSAPGASNDAASQAQQGEANADTTASAGSTEAGANGTAAGAEEKLDLAGISRPACPSAAVPGAGVVLPCLSEEATAVDKQTAEGQTDDAHADAAASDADSDSNAVTVVNMWAWWCQPCREEIPYLEEVQQKHPEWEIVGVHADQDAKRGAGMLEEMGADFVSYQDSHNTFASQLALPGVIPITIVYVGEQQKKVFAQPFRSADEIIESIEGVL